MTPDIHSIHIILDEIIQRQITRLSFIKIKPSNILNISYGATFLLKPLNDLYPSANIVTYDSLTHPAATHGMFELLPFQAQYFDCIISSMMLHFIQDIEGFFKECLRILKISGLFVTASLGSRSLHNFNDDILNPTQPLYLRDFHTLGDILLQTQFKDSVMDVETLNLTYQNFKILVKDLYNLTFTSLKIENLDNLYIPLELNYSHGWHPLLGSVSHPQAKPIDTAIKTIS